jgi:hypothetical protein
MVADPFFCLKIGRCQATVRRVPHPSMLKMALQIRRISYDSASTFLTVTIHTMVGATVGISGPSQRDMPRDFARYAAASRFWLILLRTCF